MAETQQKLRDVRKVFGEFQLRKPKTVSEISVSKSRMEGSDDDKPRAKYGKDCVEQRDYDAMDNEKFEVVKNARPATAHMRKTELKWKDAVADDAIFDDAHECERIKLAIRVVYIMKEYKLFEEGITKEETDTIKAYFTSKTRESPSDAIISLIDKSIGNALRVMRHKPERFEGAITAEVKKFIKNSRRVKPVLLDAMIAYACIPDCWGGIEYEKTVTARLAEVKTEADTKKAEENQKKEEEEKKPPDPNEQKEEGEKKEGGNDKQEPQAKETGAKEGKKDSKEKEKKDSKEKEKSKREEPRTKEATKEGRKGSKENDKTKKEEVVQKNDAKPKTPTKAVEKTEKQAKQEGGRGFVDLILKILGVRKRTGIEQRRVNDR